MNLQIHEERPEQLGPYGTVSIAFEVRSKFTIKPIDNGLGGLRFIEETVDPPYLKDYDQESDAGPERWLKRWDLSNWGVLAAYDGDCRVGGAVIAWKTAGANNLEGRDDLAALWDIRVDPAYRGQGIGAQLFALAASWARDHGCTTFKIETQNINVPACRFYAHMGAQLGSIIQGAYADLPHEVELNWYLAL